MNQLIIQDPEFRKALFARDFGAFFAYHFWWKDRAPFEDEWDRAIQSRDNLIIEAFRWSRKTSKLRWYVVWCIIHSIEPYIVVQSYEANLSAEWVRQIAKMLSEPSIVRDYGHLFPFSQKREDISKASFSNFEAVNGVKVVSKSLWEVLRGANDYNRSVGSIRPTLLVVDDADTSDSVRNRTIIDQNWRKLTGETIDAMDPFKRRIIALLNVIAEDGIGPRLKNMAETKENWNTIIQPLIVEGRSVWPEVFTEDVIENLRTTPTAFAQNYELKPYRNWDSIISSQKFKYATAYPEGSRMVIGIDPAFSTKTDTDAMALALTAHSGPERYVAKVFQFNGAEKEEEQFCAFVENLYRSYNVDLVRIESNNGGEIIGRMLKKRNLAVEIFPTTRDKITRVRENEGRFGRGEVYFLPGTEDAQKQLEDFPNAPHDDMVDALLHSFDGGPEVFTAAC